MRYSSAKKVSNWAIGPGLFLLVLTGVFLAASVLNDRDNVDFEKAFGQKAVEAQRRLAAMDERFASCSSLCQTDARFMKSIVFPEVMRYNALKDGIEAESLRTLYVQMGEDYANFSVGVFQMKPTFAQQVEQKVNQYLPDSLKKELQLAYDVTEQAAVRRQRVDRLQDEDWHLVYLTAFILICDEIYQSKKFDSEAEKLKWYATVYNAGFDKSDDYINRKIGQENFYLQPAIPGKKYQYAAIAVWFFEQLSPHKHEN
jgi:hypothetical protein